MAKKLIDIQNKIDSEAIAFRNYIDESINEEVICLVKKLSKTCNVYIFSGVIRERSLPLRRTGCSTLRTKRSELLRPGPLPG